MKKTGILILIVLLLIPAVNFGRGVDPVRIAAEQPVPGEPLPELVMLEGDDRFLAEEPTWLANPQWKDGKLTTFTEDPTIVHQGYNYMAKFAIGYTGEMPEVTVNEKPIKKIRPVTDIWKEIGLNGEGVYFEREPGLLEVYVAYYGYDGPTDPVEPVDLPAPEMLIVTFTVGDCSYGYNYGRQIIDVAPYIKEDRIMLPVRYVGEALGMTVSYEKETHRAILEEGGVNTIIIDLRSGDMILNGEHIESKVKPDLVHDRTFLPLGIIGETMGMTRETPESGYDISWDQETKTATIIRNLSQTY